MSGLKAADYKFTHERNRAAQKNIKEANAYLEAKRKACKEWRYYTTRRAAYTPETIQPLLDDPAAWRHARAKILAREALDKQEEQDRKDYERVFGMLSRGEDPDPEPEDESLQRKCAKIGGTVYQNSCGDGAAYKETVHCEVIDAINEPDIMAHGIVKTAFRDFWIEGRGESWKAKEFEKIFRGETGLSTAEYKEICRYA